MKILFTLTPAFNPNGGGVQRTTWKLGKYFTGSGYEVSYYSLAKKGHVEVPFGTLHFAPEENKNRNPENIRDLGRVLKKIKPDIVINQMPYEKELRDSLAGLKKEVGFRLIGCLRNSLFNFKNNARDQMQRMLPETLFRLMDNRAGIGLVQWRHYIKHRLDLKAILDKHDFFILLAPPNRTELEYFVGGYKKEKVRSIPNSIPAVQDQSVLSRKEKMILHVGRLNISQKRSDLLTEFWLKIHEKLPDWRFVIVGDGPYFKTLKKEIQDHNLPRIFLEGYQKPARYYQKASVFMMPSAYEGFPNTLLEAQSNGCAPVLFNSYAALDWITEDGKNAILTQPFNTEEMAASTEQLIIQQDALGTMQKQDLENARRFTIEKVGREWEQLFTGIT